MRVRTLSLLVLSAILGPCVGLAAAAGGADAVQPMPGKMPLTFEANEGQADPAVKFLLRTPGYGAFFMPDGVLLELQRPHGSTMESLSRAARFGKPLGSALSAGRGDIASLRMIFAGSDGERRKLRAGDPVETKSHYLLGSEPSAWRHNVSNFRTIAYDHLYPGIDLSLYANVRSELESDFIVSPGANPGVIRLRFDGAHRVRIGGGGELVVSRNGRHFIQHRPVAYQDLPGGRRRVRARFVKLGRDEVGFKVGRFDRSLPLVIDPAMEVAYSTFVGGAGAGNAWTALAVDTDGNAYFTCSTPRSDFAVTSGAYQRSNRGGMLDVDVVKLDPTGKRVIFSTYLGGTDFEESASIAVDSNHNVYVGGFTSSSDFPVTSPGRRPLQPTFAAGMIDGFVSKLSADGSSLIYSTYLGGDQADVLASVRVSPDGEAYAAGWTSSRNFPLTSDLRLRNSWGYEVFVTALDKNGENVRFSTLFGGTGTEETRGMALDESGNTYVTGETTSRDFPVHSSRNGRAAQAASGGGIYEGFIAKLNSTGTAVVWGTYIGGSGEDYPTGIATHGGNAYVIGRTTSLDFPTVNPVQSAYGGDIDDTFVAGISSDGASMFFATYLGGNSLDWGRNIAVDPQGSAVAVGFTESSDFPLKDEISDKGSMFVTKFTPLGDKLVFSTKYGGRSIDDATGVAIDIKGNIYISGMTGSWEFPTKSAYQPDFQGDIGNFIVKLTNRGHVYLR